MIVFDVLSLGLPAANAGALAADSPRAIRPTTMILRSKVPAPNRGLRTEVRMGLIRAGDSLGGYQVHQEP